MASVGGTPKVLVGASRFGQGGAKDAVLANQERRAKAKLIEDLVKELQSEFPGNKQIAQVAEQVAADVQAAIVKPNPNAVPKSPVQARVAEATATAQDAAGIGSPISRIIEDSVNAQGQPIPTPPRPAPRPTAGFSTDTSVNIQGGANIPQRSANPIAQAVLESTPSTFGETENNLPITPATIPAVQGSNRATPAQPSPVPATPAGRGSGFGELVNQVRGGQFTPGQQRALLKAAISLPAERFNQIKGIVLPGATGFEGASPEGKVLQDRIGLVQVFGEGSEVVKQFDAQVAKNQETTAKTDKELIGLQKERERLQAASDRLPEGAKAKKRIDKSIGEIDGRIRKLNAIAESSSNLTPMTKDLNTLARWRREVKNLKGEEKKFMEENIARLDETIINKIIGEQPEIAQRVGAVQKAVKARIDAEAKAGVKDGTKTTDADVIEARNTERLTLEDFNRNATELFAAIDKDGNIVFASGPGAADKVSANQRFRGDRTAEARTESFRNVIRSFRSAIAQAKGNETDITSAFGAGGFLKKLVNASAAPFGGIPFEDVTDFNITINDIRGSLNSAIRSNPDARALKAEFKIIMDNLPDAGLFNTNQKLAVKMLSKSMVTVLSRLSSVTGAKALPLARRKEIGATLGITAQDLALMATDPSETGRLDEAVGLELIQTYFPEQEEAYVSALEQILGLKKKVQ